MLEVDGSDPGNKPNKPASSSVPENDFSIAAELLSVYNNASLRWEYDEVIIIEIKRWLDEKKYEPERIFHAVYNNRERPEFSCLLAFIYLYGVGCLPDNKSAFNYYRIAANHGGFEQNGATTGHQIDVGSSSNVAAKTSKRYLNDRSYVAQYKLGWCHFNGQGTGVDLSLAFYWFETAALAGFREAQEFLADLYQFGKGCRQDMRKAVYWYTKSAILDNTRAQKSLAKAFRFGRGTPKDLHVAIKWYAKAMKLGSYVALGDLNRIFQNKKY